MHNTISVRRTTWLLAVLAALALCLSCAVQAQEAEWQRLEQETDVLYGQGKYSQAQIVATQALSVAEKTFGRDHPSTAMSLNILGVLNMVQGQYVLAEQLYKRAMAINEKALGTDHLDVASSLSNLASVYMMQGQYANAEPFYKRSLTISEKALGPDHPDVATSLNNLAELYRTQGQYAQAEPLYTRSLAIAEKAFGPDHPDVAGSLSNLALLYQKQGLFATAEPLFKRALSIREKALGADHPAVANSLSNLAFLYLAQGQYAQAEPLYKRALPIAEKALGPDHPDVAQILNNLAAVYSNQGQYEQAEALLKRSLAIREKALGPHHPIVAVNLNNLALLYHTQGQYAAAEPLYKRSLAIREKALGPDHPDVAVVLNNLASLYMKQGQYAQAEPLYNRSLAIYEKTLGPDHPDVATSLNNLAGLYQTQGQYAQAESLYKRSLAVREKFLDPIHPDIAGSLNNLALIYQRQSQYEAALPLARRATFIYKQRIVSGGTSDVAAREATKNQGGFFNHLSLLSRNPGNEIADKITDESLQIVQLEQTSGTASAIAKMASRFASGDDALAGLIKRKQDARERHNRGETLLVSAASKLPLERNKADEQRLRDYIAHAEKEIEAIDTELNRHFPEYQELTRSEPATVSQIRALLIPGEAILVYALGNPSFLWVVKPDGAVFQTLPVEAKDIAKKVAQIRAEMEFDNNDRPKRVSVGLLYELYQGLFVPALPYLTGVRHVLVVPAGSLQSLPFSMLVASPPPAIKRDADYRRIDWLIKHYALSVLPSVSSIKALRQFTKTGVAQEQFAGFGDPLIGDNGSAGSTRSKRNRVDVATVFRNSGVKNAPNAAQPTEIADVEAIRQSPRLPETADELRAMAKVLKSGQQSLWLQENATETRIKHLELSKYRILAFATHGVMAGELNGVGESGLILTPPQQGTLEDDGYLSASEIAKLNLNADWVILSACNTAAADGTPGAEGLSGLAKAFFYAGARSLLVSHWPVASEATVPLTTGMLKEYGANSAQSKAEAHRKAILALIEAPNHAEYAHPLFWAPFVVVGEGGSGGTTKASKATQ